MKPNSSAMHLNQTIDLFHILPQYIPFDWCTIHSRTHGIHCTQVYITRLCFFHICPLLFRSKLFQSNHWHSQFVNSCIVFKIFAMKTYCKIHFRNKYLRKQTDRKRDRWRQWNRCIYLASHKKTYLQKKPKKKEIDRKPNQHFILPKNTLNLWNTN